MPGVPKTLLDGGDNVEVTTRTWSNGSTFYITMRRHDGSFSETAWRLEKWYGRLDGDRWVTDCNIRADIGYGDGSVFDLFHSPKVSGNGVLSENNSVLSITIPNAPEMFTLKTNTIEKVYNAGSSNPLWHRPSALVWCNDFHSSGGGEKWDGGATTALLLLREDDNWNVQPGPVLGKFIRGDTVVGYATGFEIGDIVSNDIVEMGGNCSGNYSYPTYNKGGVAFTQVLTTSENLTGRLRFVIDGTFQSTVDLSNGFSDLGKNTDYDINWSNVKIDKLGNSMNTTRWG